MGNETNQDKNPENGQEFKFIQEKIKDRPINKRRLLYKVVLTTGLAVIFGAVACVTFYALKPHVDAWLNPVEVEPVTIPQDEADKEPESQPEPEVAEPVPEPEPEPEPVINVVEKVGIELDDYKELYNKLFEVASNANSFMTTVTGLSEDVDWFQNTYQSKNQTSGLIVADNGKELLILANRKLLDGAQTINVKFCDGQELRGSVKKYDGNTNLAIIGVELSQIEEKTMDAITVASLGMLDEGSLLGSPVIAIGSPLGTPDSVAYGFVTSAGNVIQSVDTDFHLITTDIYGGKDASGVLIDYQGRVLGILDQHFNSSDNANLLTALDVKDLNGTIEKLSNGQEIAYMGIYGTDVPQDVTSGQGVPQGAYVTDVQMDSPAMDEGIQAGDVIVKMGTADIASYGDFKQAMAKWQPGDIATVSVMRLGKNGYTQLNYEITLSTLK